MSTTPRATLMLGCQAEFIKVERLEERFCPLTGKPTEPVKVFDHLDLSINGKIIWSGQEKWQADELLEMTHNLRVKDMGNKVLVGRIVKKVQGWSSWEALSSPEYKEIGEIHGLLGTVPQLILVQDCY